MPDDTSPHGGEAMHPLPDRAKIPQPKPGAADDEPAREEPRPREAEVKQRPPLPDHPQQTEADVVKEETPPVGGINDTGKPSPVRQPGG